jgi:hypothetical protein
MSQSTIGSVPQISVNGTLALPNNGTATKTSGKKSRPLTLTSSAYNSTTAAAVNQVFQWQSEPVGNNTASPSGNLSLLFTSPVVALKETGFNVSSSGVVSGSSLRVGPDSLITAPITQSAIDVSTFSSPILTLSNNSGGLNASAAIDFNTFQPSGVGTYNPSARIAAVDTGNFGNDIVFSSNAQGAQNNGLQEFMRLKSDSTFLVSYGWINFRANANGTVDFLATPGKYAAHVCETLVPMDDNPDDPPMRELTDCASAAEYVPTRSEKFGYPEAGDLVRLVRASGNPDHDQHSPFVVAKTSKPCDENLMGFLLDAQLGADGTRVNEHYLPLAIYGYFPAKVTMENGTIRRGDPITASSKAGYGMKASGACKIIGYALEDANHEGKIQVFAHLTENSTPQIVGLQARMSRLRHDNLALHKQNAALQAQVQKQSESFQAALQNVLRQLEVVRVELQSRSGQAEIRMPVK